MIPSTVQILGSGCFSCESLSSVSFESNSQLTRIESNAFSSSSLQSLIIPRSVQFIDGSAFILLSLSSISIESGNEYFVVENDFLIDVIHHKLIRNFSDSSNIEITSDIEILGSSCFSRCESLSSISFESNSQLTRIESNAFLYSSLQSIMIPSTIQILGSGCFSCCESLSSISFDYLSQLRPIESLQFDGQNKVVIIPSTILFVAFNAIPKDFQISIDGCDSCVEFDRWQQMRESEISIDFRRILRIDSELGDLNDYLIDLSVFEERSVLDEFDGILSEIYERCPDGSLMIVNSQDVLESKESLILEIENLLNLCHPCILAPIGFIFCPDWTVSDKLKIVGLYSEGNSLTEVISMNPVWWTATVKAKTIAGIVLGLRFVHSLGFIHGHLNSSTIRFDVDHRIQITNFSRIGLRIEESEQGADVFSGERWSPDPDVRGFLSILIEIIIGHPAMLSGVGKDPVIVPTDIPMFVSKLIEARQLPKSRIRQTFNDIFDVLKDHDFRIVPGVDSDDVLAFVRWVESFE
jgi:hypothetical protein